MGARVKGEENGDKSIQSDRSLPECQHMVKVQLKVRLEGRERGGIVYVLGEVVAGTG